MDKQSKARELAGYSFLVVFANDHTIDENELAMLERLALADDKVADEEKHVLHNIFSRIDEQKVAEKVWAELNAFKQKHKIP